MNTLNKDRLLVYIVDDDPMFKKTMETYLKDEFPNIHSRSFSNGEDCLLEIHNTPDLILLDYKLDSEFPDAWDGLQILKRINKHNPEIGVVIISSSGSVDIIMNCVKNGVLEYILKDKKIFTRVKEILIGLLDDKTEEADIKIDTKRNIPQLIGVAILVVIIIFLFFKLK
jgi:DNA-binding NtrC family response regulator